MLRSRRDVAGLLGISLGAAGLLYACVPFGAAGESLAKTAATVQAADARGLNAALNLQYLHAQFFAQVIGDHIPAAVLGGLGQPGLASGARRAPLPDPSVSRRFAEIAEDKLRHVVALRQGLGEGAAAQPRIDLSPAAFALKARAAGLVRAGETFDPYASEENVLRTAALLEEGGLEALRVTLPAITGGRERAALGGVLAGSTYHAGLARTLLHARGLGASLPEPDPRASAQMMAASTRRFFPAGLNPSPALARFGPAADAG